MPSSAPCGAGGQERDRREFFALKPLNQLTWPELARQYLCAATQYRHCPGVTCADAVRVAATTRAADGSAAHAFLPSFFLRLFLSAPPFP